MKPFNLEAALRGEPVVTRGGHKAKIIGYVPEAQPAFRLVVFVEDNNRIPAVRTESGRVWDDEEMNGDLFMAAKKRTVWVNLYKDGTYYFHNSEKAANDAVGDLSDNRVGGKAYPLEIEE